MTKPIIYLPGFNSGPQSEKSRIFTDAFPGLLVASYDTWDTDRGYAQLTTLIEPLLSQQPILVGSSLGGFWSYHLACKYGLRCVLINPCMNPETTLLRYVGKVENFYTHETGELHIEDLQKYPLYRSSSSSSPAACTVLHEKGDELIPYEESIRNFSGKAKLILPESGHHRFEKVELILEEIRQMCEQPT